MRLQKYEMFSCWIKEIKISNNSLSGFDTNENVAFNIQPLDTDKAMMLVKNYKDYIDSIQMSNSFMVNSQIQKSVSMFRYNFYNQLCV